MQKLGWVLALVSLLACDRSVPCVSDDLAPLSRHPSYAVLRSDYASTSIALLDEAADVITESWIDSGTRASGIAVGLGGDATVVGGIGQTELAILERYQADVLTLAAFDGSSVRQIDVRGDDPQMPSGHSPNAQDALVIERDGTRAVRLAVARMNPSFDAEVPPLARGNDVVLLDLEMGRVDTRIDLNADVEVANPMQAGESISCFARPSSLAIVGEGAQMRVLVGLARLSGDFQTTGPGAIAVIDPVAASRTDLLEPTDLSGCHQVSSVPGDFLHAMALCTGDTFADEEHRRMRSGLISLILGTDGAVSIATIWRASDHPDVPPPSSGLIPIDASRAIAVADPRGEQPGQDVDRLLVIDLSGEASTIAVAGGAFVLGQGSYDAESNMLLVPDADLRAVRRFEVDPVISESQPVMLAGCSTLPPRQVARIAP